MVIIFAISMSATEEVMYLIVVIICVQVRQLSSYVYILSLQVINLLLHV